jgi:hypothetical protein
MFGSAKDFEPVFEEMVQVRRVLAPDSSTTRANGVQKDMKEPYDWDEYAHFFAPKAQELAQKASEAEKAGEQEKASELYL